MSVALDLLAAEVPDVDERACPRRLEPTVRPCVRGGLLRRSSARPVSSWCALHEKAHERRLSDGLLSEQDELRFVQGDEVIVG